jgi:hypothetical protein
MSRSHKSSNRSSSYDRTKKVQEVEDEELANLNDRLLEKGTTVECALRPRSGHVPSGLSRRDSPFGRFAQN